MLIKAADNKQSHIDALTALLTRPGIDGPTGRRIRQEIQNIRAGAKAEREAAYQIDFYLGPWRSSAGSRSLCDDS